MTDSPPAADLHSEAVTDRLTALLHQGRQSTLDLAQRTTEQRSTALKAMGDAILSARDLILEANTLDLEVSREMAVPEQVTDWLKLTPERINQVARILHRLGDLGHPFDLWVERRRPVGLVALVYESFPELGVLAAGLCLRTCNSIVLKGSNEASQTNHAFIDTVLTALANAGLPAEVIQLVPPTWSDVTRALLVKQPALDLVIPHGRPKLVEQVAADAVAPVITSYIGGCSLCICPSANLETVVEVVLDSCCGTPDAVNQISTVILAGEFEPVWLDRLWSQLSATLQLTGIASLAEQFEPLIALADYSGAHAAACDRTLRIEPVASLPEAISWLNTQGHQRVMALCTALQDDVNQFIDRANGIELYINRSPRFHRDAITATDIALGMSSQDGRIGLKALTSVQPVFYG